MGRLYIIQGERGLFKAGHTANFAARLRQHLSEFQRRGDLVLRHQAFDCPDNSLIAEQAMLRQLVAAGYRRGLGDEWFHDVDFADAERMAALSVRYALEPEFELPTIEGEPVERPVARAIRKAIKLCGGQHALARQVGVSHVCLSLILSRPNACVSEPLAMAIERVTRGRVLRQDLRPHDWMLIWRDAAQNTPSHIAYMRSISEADCPA